MRVCVVKSGVAYTSGVEEGGLVMIHLSETDKKYLAEMDPSDTIYATFAPTMDKEMVRTRMAEFKRDCDELPEEMQ